MRVRPVRMLGLAGPTGPCQAPQRLSLTVKRLSLAGKTSHCQKLPSQEGLNGMSMYPTASHEPGLTPVMLQELNWQSLNKSLTPQLVQYTGLAFGGVGVEKTGD